MWLHTLMIVVSICWWSIVSMSNVAAQPITSGGKTLLAEIDGETLAVEEVESPVALQIFRLESQIYTLRKKAIEEAIDRHLLGREAKRHGLSIEDLLRQEVETRMAPPGEDEIRMLLEKRKREAGGAQHDDAALREQLRNYLILQQLAQHRERYLADLRAKAKVVTYLSEPRAVRVPISTDGEPAIGRPGVPVTIVEFSDFQCPFCRKIQPTLKALLKEYPDSVRLVYRDFPIPRLHNEAKKAAEGARCAAEQGRFWEYHDLLFANPGRQQTADLKRYAVDLRLDEPRFVQCLATARYAKVVEHGMADGKKAGVTGTPTFFVNGIPLVGALPLERFKAVIDQELTRLGKPAVAEKKGEAP